MSVGKIPASDVGVRPITISSTVPVKATDPMGVSGAGGASVNVAPYVAVATISWTAGREPLAGTKSDETTEVWTNGPGVTQTPAIVKQPAPVGEM